MVIAMPDGIYGASRLTTYLERDDMIYDPLSAVSYQYPSLSGKRFEDYSPYLLAPGIWDVVGGLRACRQHTDRFTQAPKQRGGSAESAVRQHWKLTGAQQDFLLSLIK